MYQINATEMFSERQLLLLSEAENRRLARQLRVTRLQRSSRTGRGWPGTGFRRAIALWGRTSIPFFRA